MRLVSPALTPCLPQDALLEVVGSRWSVVSTPTSFRKWRKRPGASGSWCLGGHVLPSRPPLLCGPCHCEAVTSQGATGGRKVNTPWQAPASGCSVPRPWLPSARGSPGRPACSVMLAAGVGVTKQAL